ncbi:glycoside hydrolase [Chytriomyces sp. MP71]|nr:glycoside hydrolase [Chytriomyces sp. MP71]
MQFVKKMTIHAWQGYRTYAWGHDDLAPVRKKPVDWYRNQTLLNTAVDSLDTLYLLGLEDEYQEAKKLVLALDFSKITERVSVFETTIRVVGGLLGAYDLEGDPKLIGKCVELVDRLMPAFDTANGLPLNFMNLSSGVSYDHTGGFTGVSLAAAGTLQLEFQYLSDVTGEPRYQEAAIYVYDQMQAMDTFIPGLFPDWLNTETFAVPEQSFQIGGGADSYYEYLLKVWLSTGERKFLKMYRAASNAILNHMVKKSSAGPYTYIPVTDMTKDSLGIYKSNYRSEFGHLHCFAGGMFALGAKAYSKGNWKKLYRLGADLTDTCWTMYNSTATGLSPESVDGETLTVRGSAYKLRPEVVESLFYMWRFTHDPVYRERGWSIAQAIETHCRVEGGYRGLKDVRQVESPPWDRQESFFIAETLKYLYLLFADDDVIPLEKYVFNTEAHPLSVRGHGRRSDPEKFVPLPTSYKVPVGTMGRVSPELGLKRKLELANGNFGGQLMGVEAMEGR